MKRERVITDNNSETVIAKWDGTRFALVLKRKGNDIGNSLSIIILNPDEAMTLLRFLGNCGEEK